MIVFADNFMSVYTADTNKYTYACVAHSNALEKSNAHWYVVEANFLYLPNYPFMFLNHTMNMANLQDLLSTKKDN